MMRYDSHMRRIIMRCLVYGGLGLLLVAGSIGVGVWSGRSLRPRPMAVSLTYYVDLDSETNFTLQERSGVASRALYLFQSGLIGSRQVDTDRLPGWASLKPWGPLGMNDRRAITVLAAGWPVPSWIEWNLGPINQFSAPYGQVQTFPIAPAANAHRVYWPGLLGNLVFYTIIIAGLHMGFLAVRARRRKFGGLCPHCAYDLRGATDSEVCPECGKVTV